jgi:hypothetical protein
MAVIKKKTRKKLSKQLNKLVKRHGPELALALVTGIVSAAAAENTSKAKPRTKTPAKPVAKAPVIRKRVTV